MRIFGTQGPWCRCGVLALLSLLSSIFLVRAQDASPTEPPPVETVMQAAVNGDQESQLTIAAMYERRGSYTNAVRWYRECAGLGNAEAQFKMGFYYTVSQGVLRDYYEAVHWYALSAEQGLPAAQYNLGVACERGLGTNQNYHAAFVWYQRAANGGDAYAQKAVGGMLERGLGTQPDKVEAYKWYNLAATQGVDSAKDLREALKKQLKPEQIAEAQRRSSLFAPTRVKPGAAKSPAKSAPDKPAAKPKDFLQ